ncbi:MAG: hypothetical protein HY951_00635 [Bacteroidia bacterium]|nr:hypothetical protein [Bacteroidia bacterium]
MKTKLFITLFGLMVYSLNIIAQQPYNPYKSIGKEANVLTLSNGKYDEFFDTDSLEVIGSAVLNTRTMKVIGFITQDTLYSEATLEPEIVSRWLSPDPLARKFPYESPYGAFANNPILYTDPDGRAVRAANAEALSLMYALFSTFNTKIDGQSATGLELFGLSSKDQNDPLFKTSDVKQFQDLLNRSSLTKEQKSQATSLFTVLSASDVVEVGIVNEATTLNQGSGTENSSTTPPVYLTTANKQADALLDKTLRGDATNTEIRSTLLNQETSGKLGDNEAYGYFKNSEDYAPVGAVKGILLINDNGTLNNAFTYDFGNENTGKNSGTARDAIKQGLIKFSESKEFKKEYTK